MDTFSAVLFIVVITILFALGAKVGLYFKNREIALIKEQAEKEIKALKDAHEDARAALSEDWYKQMKLLEESFMRKTAEKDEQIKALAAELEALKAWKQEMGVKLAEFKGAAQGNPQLLIYKLLEHNQKLNAALLAHWDSIEKRLESDLQKAIVQISQLFKEAEALHRDGIEIISVYESRLPEDVKKKLHEEIAQLSISSKLPELPPAE